MRAYMCVCVPVFEFRKYDVRSSIFRLTHHAKVKVRMSSSWNELTAADAGAAFIMAHGQPVTVRCYL